MTANVLYWADHDRPDFDLGRMMVDVVCAGDSITGWNNYGPVQSWPYRTYPQFLQELCAPLTLKIANGGVAGEISENGVWQVREQLDLFLNARYFIIGYGTNDLGMWPDVERTSRKIIANLEQMVQAVVDRGKQPIFFNVPYANEAMFSVLIAKDLHDKRDYHNSRLKEFCDQQGTPLADICAHLKDERFADELHPNEAGAKIIAEEVFKVLSEVHGKSR
jgi:lysophospholipase L1-like esterase